ncbi:hypothetical protein [Polaromonas sp.]|uniref:hypothetical protein n=1 Tax=Polaromonas sp. TaxID=1869339 RepID=UPI003CAD1936
MNKFSMRSIPAAAALVATLAFSAHAQVGVGVDTGVRTGVNTNIGSDVRANAGVGVNAEASSMGTATRSNSSAGVNTDTRVGAQTSGSGVKGTVSRAANKTENAVERGARATQRGAGKAVDAVGNVARRADRRIKNALPADAQGSGQVNVQGSGNVEAK